MRELKGVGLLAEFAGAIVQKIDRAVGTHHDHVLMPVVVEIGEQRARCAFENAEPGRFSDVFKGSVAAIAIKPVGQTRRLANVEIVQTIAVNIGEGNAVMTVNIDAGRAIENRPPVVCAVKYLRLVRGVSTQRRGRDVDIEGRDGFRFCLFQHLETAQLKTAVARCFPFHAQVADPLQAVKSCSRTRDFIANFCHHIARARVCVVRDFDVGHLKFRNVNTGENFQPRFPLKHESVAINFRVATESVPPDLEPRGRTNYGGLRCTERWPSKIPG